MDSVKFSFSWLVSEGPGSYLLKNRTNKTPSEQPHFSVLLKSSQLLLSWPSAVAVSCYLEVCLGRHSLSRFSLGGVLADLSQMKACERAGKQPCFPKRLWWARSIREDCGLALTEQMPKRSAEAGGAFLSPHLTTDICSLLVFHFTSTRAVCDKRGS